MEVGCEPQANIWICWENRYRNNAGTKNMPAVIVAITNGDKILLSKYEGRGLKQFLLSVLCMKDSWRAGIPDKDKTELVTIGIYRFSRNPAFLGFDLMYVGVLLLYGNLLTLGFSVFAIVMLHLQILQEERYLVNTFGEPYQEYCRHVFRYLGRK